MGCRLVLLDLDGVLVDSRDAMEEAWRAVQHEVGVATPFAAYFAEIGRPFPDILERLGLTEDAAEISASSAPLRCARRRACRPSPASRPPLPRSWRAT